MRFIWINPHPRWIIWITNWETRIGNWTCQYPSTIVLSKLSCNYYIIFRNISGYLRYNLVSTRTDCISLHCTTTCTGRFSLCCTATTCTIHFGLCCTATTCTSRFSLCCTATTCTDCIGPHCTATTCTGRFSLYCTAATCTGWIGLRCTATTCTGRFSPYCTTWGTGSCHISWHWPTCK